MKYALLYVKEEGSNPISLAAGAGVRFRGLSWKVQAKITNAGETAGQGWMEK